MQGHPSNIPKTGGHPAHISKGPIRPLSTKKEVIARIPFFESLGPTEIINIEPHFHEHKFERNQYLFQEGDRAALLYVIKSGRVRLLKTAASGKEMIFEVMVPGQICGGDTLFTDLHRNGAQAVDATVTYGLSKEDYNELLTKYPKIAMGIIKFLGGKLMDAHDVIISLVSSKVENRIASVIVRLAENHGTHTDKGIMINIRLTRSEIADIVGATVETTIRSISRFQKKGLISTVSGKLLIKDIEAFRKMMQSKK